MLNFDGTEMAERKKGSVCPNLFFFFLFFFFSINAKNHCLTCNSLDWKKLK